MHYNCFYDNYTFYWCYLVLFLVFIMVVLKVWTINCLHRHNGNHTADYKVEYWIHFNSYPISVIDYWDFIVNDLITDFNFLDWRVVLVRIILHHPINFVYVVLHQDINTHHFDFNLFTFYHSFLNNNVFKE